MDLNTLRQEITEAFSAQWGLLDRAHRQDHFEEVTQTGLIINARLGLGFDPQLIMLTGYLHDMFTWSRKNHHQLSHLWVMSTDHPLIERLTSDERYLVGIGCLQHRASFKGSFSHPFAELMNSADRGMPDDPQAVLDRAIKFRLKHSPHMTDEERRAASVAHIKEKFGSNGYARYPRMYQKVFAGQLELQQLAIDAMQ